MTVAKLTCPCITLRTSNLLAKSDTGVVIHSELHGVQNKPPIYSNGCRVQFFFFRFTLKTVATIAY